MSRYFFNLRYGPDKLAVDPEGDELPDDASIREHALNIVRQMIKTPSHSVRDWMTCVLEVMDQEQKLICIVPFTDIIPEGRDNRASE